MFLFTVKNFFARSFFTLLVAVGISFGFSFSSLAASTTSTITKKKLTKKSDKKTDENKKSEETKKLNSEKKSDSKKIDPKKGVTGDKATKPTDSSTAATPKINPNRRIASEGPYSREDFYIDEKAELEKSLKKLVEVRAEKSAKLSQKLTSSNDPWSFSQTIRTNHTYTDPYQRNVTGQTALKYTGVEGFVFQTTVDSYDSNFFGRGDSRYSHNNYGFSISQDLVALFGKSKFDFDTESAEIQTKTKIISAESNYLSEALKLIDATNGLFSAYCKKFDNDIIFKQAQETLRVSEIQHSAKTITTKDLLRIQDTVLSLEKQKQSIEYEIMSQENFFATVSPEAYELAKKLATVKVACEENTDSLNKLKYPERSTILDVVKQYPSLISIELSKESLKKQSELYVLQKKPSISISLGQDRTSNVVRPHDAYNDNYIGITFSYQFHGDQYSIYKQVLAEQQVDLNISQKQSTFDIQNYLIGLYNQLDNYLNQLPLSKRSTSNAADLLKIIQTQQSIGQLDATAIDSAYSAYSQAISSEREILAQVTALVVKLNEIKLASEKAALVAKTAMPVK